jgi:putative colanic acid biosynthesis UDP-glucose lipid carrier transferase
MKTRENELLFISVVVDLLLLNSIFFVLFLTVFQSYSFDEPGIYVSFLSLNLARLASYFIIQRRIIYHKKGFRPRFNRMLKRSGVFLTLIIIIPIPVCEIYSFWPGVLLVASAFIFLILKFGFNYLYYRLVKQRVKYSSRAKKVLLLEKTPLMRDLKKVINFNPALNYKYIATYARVDGKSNEMVYAELEKRVLVDGVQVMFIAVNEVEDETAGPWNLAELLFHCNRWGVRLYYVPKLPPTKKDELKVDRLNGFTIFNPQRIPLDEPENQIKKRLFDVAFASLFIIFVLSWLFPIIALIIKLTSRGPVLFIQPRTGINNRTFQCYKFRSMEVNKEAHEKQATKNDPRITAIGRFMRRTNIDELPQFINVLWGDMSVVGPRPHMLAHTELFSKEVENYLVRHYVKPGVTGWAQVNGFRGETSEKWQIEKRVQYDHEYIRNWSFDWDFVIVWKTTFSLKAFQNAL